MSKADASAPTKPVKEALHALMRTKARHVEIGSLSALAKAARVQRKARELDIELNSGDALREVLKKVLEDLVDEEARAKALDAHYENFDESARYPVAKPALELLGLTSRSESRTIGPRQVLAAPLRSPNITARTMRNPQHEEAIEHDLALYLLSDDDAEPVGNSAAPSIDSVFERVRSLSCIPARDEYSSDQEVSVAGLSQGALRQLAVETALSYKGFEKTVLRLFDDLCITAERDPLSPGIPPVDDDETPAEGLPDENYFLCLHALTARGFDELLGYLPSRIIEVEDAYSSNLYCWLARVLRVLWEWLPGFSRREEDLLKHAHQEADNNLHIFLETLERSETGRKILGDWLHYLQSEPSTYDIGKCLWVWQSGLAAAQALVSPGGISHLGYLRLVGFLMQHGQPPDPPRRKVGDLEWLRRPDGLRKVEDDRDDQGRLFG